MSAMRKMGVYLGLFEDAEQEYVDEEAFADEYSDQEAARPVSSLAEHRNRSHGSEIAQPVVPRPRTAEVGLSRITTLHPRTYNEARVVGENFRDGIPVIMNLSEMEDADAKRLVDFAAGLVFSVRGSIERVTSKVFLLSPPDVSVGMEVKQRVAEGDFFNQS